MLNYKHITLTDEIKIAQTIFKGLKAITERYTSSENCTSRNEKKRKRKISETRSCWFAVGLFRTRVSVSSRVVCICVAVVVGSVNSSRSRVVWSRNLLGVTLLVAATTTNGADLGRPDRIAG